MGNNDDSEDEITEDPFEETEEIDETTVETTSVEDGGSNAGSTTSTSVLGGRSIANMIQQRNEILNAESNAGLPTLLPRTGADVEENNIDVRFIMVILLAALIQLVAVKYQKL